MLDADGDLALVQSKRSGAANFSTYATNFSYTSAGAVSSMQLGNGRWESTAFNERLQPTQIALGTTPNATNLLKLNFEYGKLNWDGSTLAGTNNGNVSKQTINTPNTGNTYGFVATQYYTYDALNRSEIASENLQPNDGSLMINGWRQNYSYDRYGNRRFIITGDSSTTTIPAGCADVVCNPQIDPNTNKLIGYTYDDAGNTRIDATGRGFSYDAENKQTEVRDGNNIVVGRYYYDGDGKRVKKVSASETTIFVYDAGGKLIAEYSNQISQTPQISYLTSDHLGSPRIITDGSGNVTSRRDFQPFGEEVRTWYRVPNLGYAVADDVRQKFTGYERDDETDLDFAQARMHNYNHGRFTSPDPLMSSAKTRNPQTFNRYSYVLNNPLNFIDPFGLSVECPQGKDCKKDDEGNEYYLEDGSVVYTSEVATVHSVEEQSTVTIGLLAPIFPKVIEKVPWWKQVLRPIGNGATTAGKTLARGGGAIFFILTNPSPIGCSGLNELPDGNGGCMKDPNKVDQDTGTGNKDDTDENRDEQVTYYHYTTATPESFVIGMLPGSSATTRGDLYANQASQGLGIPLPTLVYPVTINPRITTVINGGLVDSSRRYAGGSSQVYFPNGTPPGSVGLPRRVPR